MSAGSKLKNFLFNSFSKKINYRFFNITFIKIYFAMQFFSHDNFYPPQYKFKLFTSRSKSDLHNHEFPPFIGPLKLLCLIFPLIFLLYLQK